MHEQQETTTTATRMSHRNILQHWRIVDAAGDDNAASFSRQQTVEFSTSSPVTPLSTTTTNFATTSPAAWGGGGATAQPSQQQLLPAARFGHTSLVFGNHMVTFGGRNSNTAFYNDVWTYDMSQHKWQPKWECSGSQVITPRAGHTATLVQNRYMYVVGGHDGTNEAGLADVWTLDLRTQMWCLSSSGQASQPSSPTRRFDVDDFTTTMVPRGVFHQPMAFTARKGHTTVCLDDTMLVTFGGSADHKTWMYDIRTARWSPLRVTGTPPQARSYHVAELTDRRSMLVFGGKLRCHTFCSDLYELILPSSASSGSASALGIWRQVDIQGPLRPCARYCCSSIYLNGVLTVFLGGSTCYHNDSYEFDVATSEWRALPALGAGLPPCTRPTTVRHGNTIALFGGCMEEACINVVLELGLEAPTLKELCREWLRSKGGLSQATPRTPMTTSHSLYRTFKHRSQQVTSPYAAPGLGNYNSYFADLQSPAAVTEPDTAVLPRNLRDYLLRAD